MNEAQTVLVALDYSSKFKGKNNELKEKWDG